MKNKIYKKWWFWVLLIIGIGLINGIMNPQTEQQRKQEQKQEQIEQQKEKKEKEQKKKAEQEQENKATLITTAKEVVKKNLKAPSTAKFPWAFDEYNIKETNSKNKDMTIYYVSGYVDAENSFGAKIRNNFIVKLECTKDLKKYRVLDVQITE